MALKMDKATKFMKMEINMKENLKMENRMEKEFCIIQVGRNYIMGNGKMEK